MMRKKRGYNKVTPIELVRDYKLFAIACEGEKREPEYFKLFRFLSKKIAVDVIEEIVSDEEAMGINPNKSAPKWVLDRALKYIEKEGLSDEDDLWFVMDIDRWETAQLHEIASYCEKFPNWHIVLSNPCFEIWLYFHKKKTFENSTSSNCNDFKNEISTFEKGGYHPLKFIQHLPAAITNAKNADTDEKYFMPNYKVSKVYQLGEAVLQIVGINDFNEFIEQTLPKMLQSQKEKSRYSKRKI
jgi:hypothetical protein